MFDRSRHIAVTAGTFVEDVRQVPVLARQLGFHGVQFPAFSSAMNLPELSESGRREFRRLFVTQQVELASLSFESGPKGLGAGADVDRALQRIDEALEVARALGISVVCVDIGALPPAPPAPPKPKVSQDMAGLLILPPEQTPAAAPAPLPADQELAAQLDSALVDLGQRADRYAVAVAFRTDLAGFAAVERALLSVRCPWFGIDLDPVALLRDEWDRDEIFSRLASSIRHVRGRDAVAGENGRSRPAVVGKGNTDWSALFAQLDAADYRGWLTIDPLEARDRPAAAAAGLLNLRVIER